VLLDQTRLPAAESYLTCGDVPQLVGAIRRLAVRGAPLLGVAGAYGVALAAMRGDDVEAAAAVVAVRSCHCSVQFVDGCAEQVSERLAWG
jgi:methylthioribose-1-phosphate isomerase